MIDMNTSYMSCREAPKFKPLKPIMPFRETGSVPKAQLD